MASDEVLLVVLAFIAFGGIFWYLFQRQNSAARVRLQRAESINRLIDKFATGKEVTEFMQTEQGRKLLEDPVPVAENPRFRVLRFVQAGVIFLFVGLGFLMNATRLGREEDINYIRQSMDLRFWGIFSLVLGGGLLVVGYLTSELVKKWGLDSSKRNINQ